MSRPDYDVFIIGAGQAGPPLAMALARAGQRVALAERKHAGGSCINFGCTPTKAAIASARVAHLARRASKYGIRVPNVEVDYKAVLERARNIAVELRTGLEKSLGKTANLAIILAHARLVGRDGDAFRLNAGAKTVTAARVVLDTGTRSVIPPIEGLDRADCVHAGNWLDVPELPTRLAIIGGGYIGLEMAQFYRRLGANVVVIESGGQVASHEDPDIASALQQLLEAEGIEFRLNAKLEKIEGRPGELKLRVGADTIAATQVFSAVGRRPNTDDLGLDTVGVKTDRRGFIDVDKHLVTSVPGVWAAGDIRGGPMFTHTSWDDYRVIESQLIGDGSRTTERVVPYAVFTDPELGRVGMTEQEARKAGHEIRIGRFEMKGNGKAIEIGETHGFIKVVVDASNERLLGAAVLATEGAELVHICIALMNARARFQTMRDAVFIHPTLAEAVQSAVATIEERSSMP